MGQFEQFFGSREGREGGAKGKFISADS